MKHGMHSSVTYNKKMPRELISLSINLMHGLFDISTRSTRNYSTNHLKGLSPEKCIPISKLVKNTEEVRTNGK